MDFTPVEVGRLARHVEPGVPAEPPPWGDRRSDPGHLPPTDMVCGREGRPRSHRYYLVHGVPPDHDAGNETARHFPAGRRGPRTARWQAAGGGGEVLALLGTGNQATVPPSTRVGPD